MLVFGLVFLLSSGLVFAQELPEEPYVDPNPSVVTYKAVDGILTISTTHAEPLIKTETHNIAEVQAKADKIDGVIQLWQNKKLPHQAIIDKYNQLKAE